jgi:hypothetical protein
LLLLLKKQPHNATIAAAAAVGAAARAFPALFGRCHLLLLSCSKEVLTRQPAGHASWVEPAQSISTHGCGVSTHALSQQPVLALTLWLGTGRHTPKHV